MCSWLPLRLVSTLLLLLLLSVPSLAVPTLRRSPVPTLLVPAVPALLRRRAAVPTLRTAVPTLRTAVPTVPAATAAARDKRLGAVTRNKRLGTGLESVKLLLLPALTIVCLIFP